MKTKGGIYNPTLGDPPNGFLESAAIGGPPLIPSEAMPEDSQASTHNQPSEVSEQGKEPCLSKLIGTNFEDGVTSNI